MKSSLSQLPNKYDLVKDTLVLILAGGRGSRLHELTDKRAKPALYFGGNRRIIDFALSNCINSGLNRIGVVTQYAAHSLLRHLQKGWSFLPQERGEFIDMLPARQQIDDSTWYRGTADAVYQNMAIIRNHYKPKRSEEHTSELQSQMEEHTSELQSQIHLVCRLLLEKKKFIRK